MRFSGLWRHADFMKLWTGQTISVFGSMVGGTAMSFVAILVLQATPLQMGILNALNLLPGFVVGLIAGAWVDRLHRRPFLIWADLGRALVLSSIPLAALLGVLHIAQVYVVALLVSILTLFFDVAYQSYLPALIPKEHLVEGNSKLSASAAVAEFGGFSLGGWLVQALTPPFAVLIDAMSFVISALSVGVIRSREAAIVLEAEPNLRSEIIAGLHAVRGNPLLRASAVALLIQNLSNGMYGALVVLYMSRGLGFQPGVLGMIWAVGGISSFVGAALAPRLTHRLGLGLIVTIGLTVSGLSGLFIPLASGATWISALLMVLAQLGDGFFVVYEINLVSLRQSIAPQAILGRVNATMRFLALGATLGGSLLGGLLGEVLNPRLVLVLGAAGTLLGALYLGLSPVRRVKN